MQTLPKYFMDIVFLTLFFMASAQAADDNTVQADVSMQMAVPASRAMNIKSDDPLLQEILRYQQNAANRPRRSQSAQQGSRSATSNGGQSGAKSKTEIIELEIPDNLPPVVNRTKSFVFTDITDRSNTQPSTQLDLDKRMNQIEILRQQALSQQD